MKIKRLVFLFLIIVLPLFCCNGCYYKQPYYKKISLMTEQDYQAIAMLDDLKEDGVKVSLYSGGKGNKKGGVKLLLAEDTIFNPNSTNFSKHAFVLLDKVVVLMNLYEEEGVKVQGSGPVLGAENHVQCAKALSLARVHRVVQYLWSQNINASFAYAENQPSKTPGYIEIDFKKY